MIAQSHRFHGYGSLRFVYRQGKTIRGPLVSLKFVRNARRSKYRVAVVVSKKVSKSAVVRNRIRRRVYEIVRTQLAPDQPYDLVFTAFGEQLADVPANDLQKMIVGQLKTAHLEPVSPAAAKGGHVIVDKKER